MTEDLITILQVLERKGGTDCTGTCHHRKPGEFHCHAFARMLNISSQGVKNRLLKLLRQGLVERRRLDRPQGAPLVRFVLTDEGRTFVARYQNNEVASDDPSDTSTGV